jgi:hypothetical protein
VTADRQDGADWVVSSGVAPGDKVIVSGLQRVQPGAPAKAVPYVPEKQAKTAEWCRSRRAAGLTRHVPLFHQPSGLRVGHRDHDRDRGPARDPLARRGVVSEHRAAAGGRVRAYPGASAETVERAVTQIIEQQLTGIDNLDYFSASSGSDGSASLNLTFKPGTDPDIAQMQVQNKVSQARRACPATWCSKASRCRSRTAASCSSSR